MIENFPESVPEPHRRFLRNLIEQLRTDTRIVGVAAGGSYLTDSMDEFSDLDLIVAIQPDDYIDVLADRQAIAASLGTLLAAFTGEHVGEPRLLICLYQDPLLHVDLKFVALGDVAKRVEDPVVLWEREGRLSRALRAGTPEYPAPDPQWIENRFWTWVHYTGTKIGRGELFEALDCLSFLRGTVLGPLALVRAGGRAAGVRRIETAAPEFAQKLRATVARYEAADCLRALRACAELYRSVRSRGNEVGPDMAAESAAVSYLARVEQQLGLN
jgi:predicted nucleotidyltransferase